MKGVHANEEAVEARRDMEAKWSSWVRKLSECKCVWPVLASKYGRAWLCRRCGYTRGERGR